MQLKDLPYGAYYKYERTSSTIYRKVIIPKAEPLTPGICYSIGVTSDHYTVGWDKEDTEVLRTDKDGNILRSLVRVSTVSPGTKFWVGEVSYTKLRMEPPKTFHYGLRPDGVTAIMFDGDFEVGVDG